MRTAAALLALLLHGCALQPQADADSDAPEARSAPARASSFPASYAQALQAWASAEQVNAWIGERFEYDSERSMRLSESQRQAQGSLPIHVPEQFYAQPQGVCVDLARFAVETLQAIAPASQPAYLMLEFDPVQIRGNTLRRHWVATFERDGQHYFFADSKRPGHIAGPYADTQAYVRDYAQYRGRSIVAFRELPSYQRRMKTRAQKQQRDAD